MFFTFPFGPEIRQHRRDQNRRMDRAPIPVAHPTQPGAMARRQAADVALLRPCSTRARRSGYDVGIHGFSPLALGDWSAHRRSHRREVGSVRRRTGLRIAPPLVRLDR